MTLTSEQRNAVICEENALLEACPGSGKTRTIVAKAIRCIDNVRNTPRKIAVITYTNTAVYEIESRLRIYGSTGDLDCCEVSTIHSFCLNNILNAFYWRLSDYTHGFKLISPDADEYETITRRICGEQNLPTGAREEFRQLNRSPEGEPILPTTSVLTSDAAYAFWQELRDIGVVDFATLLFLTNCLLKQFPSLANALSCRFRWILVDEFQDTTELQIEILKKIYNAHQSQFFLVGDPHQSIFGFAGARPILCAAFCTYIMARQDFPLSKNWRSNPQIIAHAELLLPRATPMQAAGPIANDACKPEYIGCGTAFEAIEDHFLPRLDELGIAYGEAAILAPWWVTLLPLGRKLREYGVPVIGPGARPYKGSHLFARLAEYICEYVERHNPTLIRNVERELYRLILEACRVSRFDVFRYSGRVTIFRMLKIAAELRSESESAEKWLIQAADAFANLLVRDGLLPVAAMNLLPESARSICEQMRNNPNVDLPNLTVSDLGLFAATDRSMHLMTIHAAKGLEFAAVALVGLHEKQIPYFLAQTPEAIDEARRLFYVAITRAKRFLLYITDRSNAKNVPTRFLGRDGLNLLNA